MKILACAGANGDEKATKKLTAIAKERQPDAILFAGGIISTLRDTPHREDFMPQFFRMIAENSKFVAAIPGPNDAPLAKFLRVALNTEMIYPNVFIAHATTVTNRELAVNGIGGLLTESEDENGPVIKYSHASTEYFLRSLWRVEKPIKVLMLSETPMGQLSGVEGNSLVNEFIKTYHPAICIVAGNRDSRGVEREKHEICVNPGQITEGSAAWIDTTTQEVNMLDF